MDEIEILKQVSFDINEYRNHLEEANQDGKITQEEMVSLNAIKQKVIDNAITVANFDENMDADEKALITKLTEILCGK